MALVAAAAVVIVGLAAAAVVAAVLNHACALPAPQPDLPPQLRSVGDFGQPYPPGDNRGLSEAATTIAATLNRDLLGAAADHPVEESATDAQHHDATVVPLRHLAGVAEGARVVGLVVFLDDCSGRRYFNTVRDLLSGRDAAGLATEYPSVSAPSVSQQLGSASPTLSYRDDPAAPVWRNRSTGVSVPAFSPGS